MRPPINRSAEHCLGLVGAMVCPLAGTVPGAPITRFLVPVRGRGPWRLLTILMLSCCLMFVGGAEAMGEIQIEVRATQVTHTNSAWLTGACLEDVNHEVYGGIDSQMIFGESFAEPAPARPLKGLTAFGGTWTSEDGRLTAPGDQGSKMVVDAPAFADGEASVELWFAEGGTGNAGLIVKVAHPGNGADSFDGYEVSLEPAGFLVFGRHRQNWEPLRRVPCAVPLKEWVRLAARMTTNALEVLVNGHNLLRYEDTEHPLVAGTVGLRTWQHAVQFRKFSIRAGGQTQEFAFEPVDRSWGDSVSGAWRPLREGTATGQFALVGQAPFNGRQSQTIVFTAGIGAVGIENRSLNRWGMNLVRHQPYEGYLYARAEKPTEVYVSLEDGDGSRVYAQQGLKISGLGWQRVSFRLTPAAADSAGRFAIKLRQPGAVTVGYVLLQPGEWGRFKGLPVRKDVGEGLVHQGVTVLRYGGCMANAAEYRWKKMTGPRAQRPPYAGWWYPHASNGWGIFEFLNYCEAAGFLGIPDVNINESPQDMVDFMEYVNGAVNTRWGKQRALDGHTSPYHLKYLELGNEERVDENYFRKFLALAAAIWARDPDIILVVGDFAYNDPITDPLHITGNPDHLTTLATQQKILQLAKAHQREVWFDVHVNTEGPRPDFGGTFSYLDAIDRLADGAKHRVAIFELNAGNHAQRRALANAAAILRVERDGRLPICTSANCLQPDGQNDNDWNQGLLFLNPAQAWLQPPGYVTRMIADNFQPLELATEVQNAADQIVAGAQRSADGKILVVQVVNFADQDTSATLDLHDFVPGKSTARVEELAAPLDAQNPASAPKRVSPVASDWRHQFQAGKVARAFPAHSFTVIRFQ